MGLTHLVAFRDQILTVICTDYRLYLLGMRPVTVLRQCPLFAFENSYFVRV